MDLEILVFEVIRSPLSGHFVQDLRRIWRLDGMEGMEGRKEGRTDHLLKQGYEVVMEGTKCRIKEILLSDKQNGKEELEEEEAKVEEDSDVEKETEYLQQYFEQLDISSNKEAPHTKRNEYKIEIPSKVSSIDECLSFLDLLPIKRKHNEESKDLVAVMEKDTSRIQVKDEARMMNAGIPHDDVKIYAGKNVAEIKDQVTKTDDVGATSNMNN
ncbi:hypothetical protein L1987_35161 [Smallanthus sonchifolius]|uniref:Uncharacterized protein n=1 Tax=Smallanthus sonchifolius TaxID=185202 RepID=A0ACB9HXB1_9ASTR|nr:hypothetical protein L1987_35161 [Smallanthus sonchifolius]